MLTACKVPGQLETFAAEYSVYESPRLVVPIFLASRKGIGGGA